MEDWVTPLLGSTAVFKLAQYDSVNLSARDFKVLLLSDALLAPLLLPALSLTDTTAMRLLWMLLDSSHLLEYCGL